MAAHYKFIECFTSSPPPPKTNQTPRPDQRPREVATSVNVSPERVDIQCKYCLCTTNAARTVPSQYIGDSLAAYQKGGERFNRDVCGVSTRQLRIAREKKHSASCLPFRMTR